MCVRAVVPFAVVEAVAEAQLPMLAGCLPDLLDRPHTATLAHGATDDDDGRGGGGGWIVVDRRSHCGRSSIWLERITARDGMRIATQHWARLVEERCLVQPCVPRPEDNTHSGEVCYVPRVRLSRARDHGPRDDLPARDIVKIWGSRARAATRDEARYLRDEAATHGKRVPYPWNERIHVFHAVRGSGLSAGTIVGWVQGDERFLFLLDHHCHGGAFVDAKKA